MATRPPDTSPDTLRYASSHVHAPEPPICSAFRSPRRLSDDTPNRTICVRLAQRPDCCREADPHDDARGPQPGPARYGTLNPPGRPPPTRLNVTASHRACRLLAPHRTSNTVLRAGQSVRPDPDKLSRHDAGNEASCFRVSLVRRRRQTVFAARRLQNFLGPASTAIADPAPLHLNTLSSKLFAD
jgi:hypothetical protein